MFEVNIVCTFWSPNKRMPREVFLILFPRRTVLTMPLL